MSVHISLPGVQDRPYTAGAVLKGEVKVRTKPRQKGLASFVVLDFCGTSEVLITRRKLVNDFKYTQHHRFELDGAFAQQPRPTGSQTKWQTFRYETKCVLFAHQQLISRQRHDDIDTTSFPFELVIPSHAEPHPPPVIAAHGSNCFQASGYFTGSLGYYPPNKPTPPQPLPDTMSLWEGIEDGNNSGSASVRYILRATAPQLDNSGSSFFNRSDDFSASVEIPLCNPLAPSARPQQPKHSAHEEVIRTMRLLPDHSTGSKLSFRDNMRSIFQKDRLPWLALGLTFQAPDTLWLDRPSETPLPFAINVQRLSGGVGHQIGPSPLPGIKAAANMIDHPCYVPNPRVSLKSLTLSLVAHTALRGGDDKFSGFGPKRFEALTPSPFFEYQTSRSSPVQIGVPVSEVAWLDLGTTLGVTIGHLWSAADVKGGIGGGGITGDFLTPNIMRRWGIEWDVTFECAGEEVHWRSESAAGGGLGVRLLRGHGEGRS